DRFPQQRWQDAERHQPQGSKIFGNDFPRLKRIAVEIFGFQFARQHVSIKVPESVFLATAPAKIPSPSRWSAPDQLILAAGRRPHPGECSALAPSSRWYAIRRRRCDGAESRCRRNLRRNRGQNLEG